MAEKVLPGMIRRVSAVMFLVTATLAWGDAPATDDEKADALRGHIPEPGVFPPKGAGVHLAGDLVVSDPINRRGAIRKGGNAPRHYFAMLPYGMVSVSYTHLRAHET